MAKRFEKMTPEEKFVRLMIRGWKEKKKGYSNRDGYGSVAKNQYCAFGVVATELGVPLLASAVRDRIGYIPYGVTTISDNAGSKTKAMREVKKFLLGR